MMALPNMGPLTRGRKAAMIAKQQQQQQHVEFERSVDKPSVDKPRAALSDLSNIFTTPHIFSSSHFDSKKIVQKAVVSRTRRGRVASRIAVPENDNCVDGQRDKSRNVSIRHRAYPATHPLVNIMMDDNDVPRQFEFTDIDIHHRENDCGFASYCNEIYDFMRANEIKHCICEDYFVFKSPDINHKMRTILLDWLVEVAEEFSLSPQTLFLSGRLFDTYMHKTKVERKYLQLVGITCMFIASKYEEIHPPSAEEFSYITDYTYTTSEVVAMEDIILRKLEFHISIVTSWEFRRRFRYAVEDDDVALSLSAYFLELSLQERISLLHRPSILAAASISLALQTLNKPHWTSALTHNTGYKYTTVRRCVLQLHELFIKVKSRSGTKISAVTEKYSREENHQVSTLSPPDLIV